MGSSGPIGMDLDLNLDRTEHRTIQLVERAQSSARVCIAHRFGDDDACLWGHAPRRLGT